MRSFNCTKTRVLRYIPQLAVVHSFLVLLSAAVLLLLSAAVAAWLWGVRLFFFSFCFFRACVASVRCYMFVWQKAGCLLKMAPHSLLGPLLPWPTLKEGGNQALVRLRSFIIIYRHPVNVRAHNCYNFSSVVLSFHELSTPDGGEGAAVVRSLPRHGDTRHQTTGTKPASLTRRRWKDAHQDQPFQCTVPFPARRSLASNLGLCALSRSESLSARCSLIPKLCPRDAPSFRSLARAPIARSEVWPMRCSAVPPLRTLARALLRLSFAPSPCPCLLLVATPRLCPPNRCLRHV